MTWPWKLWVFGPKDVREATSEEEAEFRRELHRLPLERQPTAYFVVLSIEPPTQVGPAGAWSYRGQGTAMFGYLLESDEIDSPEKAARQFAKEAVEHNLVPPAHTLLERAHVGIIHDSMTVELQPEDPYLWESGT